MVAGVLLSGAGRRHGGETCSRCCRSPTRAQATETIDFASPLGEAHLVSGWSAEPPEDAPAPRGVRYLRQPAGTDVLPSGGARGTDVTIRCAGVNAPKRTLPATFHLNGAYVGQGAFPATMETVVLRLPPRAQRIGPQRARIVAPNSAPASAGDRAPPRAPGRRAGVRASDGRRTHAPRTYLPRLVADGADPLLLLPPAATAQLYLRAQAEAVIGLGDAALRSRAALRVVREDRTGGAHVLYDGSPPQPRCAFARRAAGRDRAAPGGRGIRTAPSGVDRLTMETPQARPLAGRGRRIPHGRQRHPLRDRHAARRPPRLLRLRPRHLAAPRCVGAGGGALRGRAGPGLLDAALGGVAADRRHPAAPRRGPAAKRARRHIPTLTNPPREGLGDRRVGDEHERQPALGLRPRLRPLRVSGGGHPRGAGLRAGRDDPRGGVWAGSASATTSPSSSTCTRATRTARTRPASPGGSGSRAGPPTARRRPRSRCRP